MSTTYLGKASSDTHCTTCGAPLSGITASFDPETRQCVLKASCPNGHDREASWAAETPPPLDTLPLVSQVTVTK